MNTIELLPSRLLFSQAGWTTVEIPDPSVSSGSVPVSIPVTYDVQPSSKDARYGESILKLVGTSNADTFRLATTPHIIQDAPGETHIAFGYGGGVAQYALDDSAQKSTDDDPAEWRYWLDSWFNTYSRGNRDPVIYSSVAMESIGYMAAEATTA